MTVFVTQQPTPNKFNWVPDLTPAAEYGKIEYVFEGGEAIYSNPVNSMKKAKFRLENFNPSLDYLLYPGTGDPAAFAVCIMAILDKGYDTLPLLYWDRIRDDNGSRDSKKGIYVPINFTL